MQQQSPSKRALILSGGGLFGAWQVGAWAVLREAMHFDAVIGVSIGSLNGWAIAGGATPEELTAIWLEAAGRCSNRLRFPRNPLDGILDPTEFHELIYRLYNSYRPRMEYYAVITDLLRAKPRLVDGRQMRACHLEASCALLGMLPQKRIDGVLYTDGGFLGALPLWAARPCQATQVIGLNAMPRMPWPVRAVLKPLRSMRKQPPKLDRNSTVVLSPTRSLGHYRQGLIWRQAEIARWIEQGRTDAQSALAHKNIFASQCFMA